MDSRSKDSHIETDADGREAVSDTAHWLFFVLDQETPRDDDTDYKPLYYGLYNGISLIIDNTHAYNQTIAALKELQWRAEDAYIRG
jgi:hypothetical protein